MYVYRIQKDKKFLVIGESFPFLPLDLDACSSYRKETEILLESSRKEQYPEQSSRLTSLFVFPACSEALLIDRAKYWASRYINTESLSSQCYLIKLKINKPIQFHDATIYEKLCVAKKYNQSVNEAALSTEYWHELDEDETNNCLEAEGLAQDAIIVSVDSCFVTHDSFSIVEKDVV